MNVRSAVWAVAAWCVCACLAEGEEGYCHGDVCTLSDAGRVVEITEENEDEVLQSALALVMRYDPLEYDGRFDESYAYVAEQLAGNAVVARVSSSSNTKLAQAAPLKNAAEFNLHMFAPHPSTQANNSPAPHNKKQKREGCGAVHQRGEWLRPGAVGGLVHRLQGAAAGDSRGG